jgi:hypothetical protein
MPKGVGSDALKNSGTATNLANQYSSNAAGIYGGLENELSSQAAHPTGLTPTQKATQNTAAQQSAGGGTAGAIGAGSLYSARTHNAGGAKAAIGQAVRGAGSNLSDAALSTEQQDASLQNKNRNSALSGMEGLNTEQTSAGEGALGLSNQALGVADQADANNPWMKLLQSGIGAGGQVGAAALES